MIELEGSMQKIPYLLSNKIRVLVEVVTNLANNNKDIKKIIKSKIEDYIASFT